MPRRISERGNRVGSAYALTTFARVLPRPGGRARGLPGGAAARRREPVRAALDTLHIARVQIFRALVHQGPKQRHTDALRHAHLVFTSTIDGDLDPYLDALAASACRRPTSGGGAAPAIRGARTAPRSGPTCARSQAPPGLFQSAMPARHRRRGARGAGAARARDRLRRRGPGPRRRRAAGALPRDASDARPPAERPPPRAASAADIDLADIQGNVLRGYTMPAAAYLFLRIVDVGEGARADDADAAAGETADAVDGAARDRDERRVHVRRAGGARAARRRAGVVPGGVPRGHGGARRAARRPRAERAVERGSSHGAHVLVTRLRGRRRAPARGAGRDPRRRRRRAASSSSTCSAPRRWPAAATTSASSTGSRSPRSPARASRRGRATASPTARAAGARSRRARCCSATSTRTARCPPRPPRRSTATARSSSTASWRWTWPPSAATSPSRTPTRAAPNLLAAKIVGRWPDGTPLALSPERPDAAVSSDPLRINDFGYAGRPRRAAVPARRPHPPRQPARRRPASSTGG